MTLRTRYAFAATLVLAMVSQVAFATATLTRDDRQMDVFLDLTDLGGTTFFPSSPVSPAFGDPWNAVLGTGSQISPNGAADGEATATHNSSFDTTPTFSSITASGTANAFGMVDSFDINSAQAEAESIFEIEFTIATLMDYTLAGSVLDEGSGSTGRVRLRPVGGSDIFIANSTGPFTDAGQLTPGDYELIGEAKALGFASDSGATFFDLDGAFDFSFTIVPEPASVLLILLGAGLCVRRSPSS